MTTDYINTMNLDGVLILNNQISLDDIEMMKAEIHKIRQYVMEKIIHMTRPLSTYTDIAERQLNRLDYRCGFTSSIFQHIEKPIIKLIQSLSPYIDFMHYWGAIPSLPGSGPTDMHRDIYPFFNNAEGNDINDAEVNLPPYYFTVFMPLVEITQENGPTEFIKGSHCNKLEKDIPPHIYAPLLSPGDLVIFDGRTLHRGRANNSNQERLIAYITFTANWYHDQTFRINNYLFPELNKAVAAL